MANRYETLLQKTGQAFLRPKTRPTNPHVSVDPYPQVRPWILGANYDKGSYSFKVIEFPINTQPGQQPGMTFNSLPMGSAHPNGANFLVADGSVHFLVDDIELMTYQNLGSCNGGDHGRLSD